MIYLTLFFEFCRVGLFAIGGGLATLPFLYELGAKTAWFSSEAVLDMLAISESTPGPIGVNMATYVGFTTAGVLGGIVATLGLVFPSIVVILIVAKFLERFKESRIVQSAFYGLRPASVALIAAAGYSVIKVTFLNSALFSETGKILDFFDWKSVVLAAFLFILIKLTKWHPIVFIALSAVIGIVFNFAG